MTWETLVKSVGSQAHTAPSATQAVLRHAFGLIAEDAIHGRKTVVPGFGVFYKATRKARRIRDIKTRLLIPIPAAVSVGFHCSKTIKR